MEYAIGTSLIRNRETGMFEIKVDPTEQPQIKLDEPSRGFVVGTKLFFINCMPSFSPTNYNPI